MISRREGDLTRGLRFQWKRSERRYLVVQILYRLPPKASDKTVAALSALLTSGTKLKWRSAYHPIPVAVHRKRAANPLLPLMI